MNISSGSFVGKGKITVTILVLADQEHFGTCVGKWSKTSGFVVFRFVRESVHVIFCVYLVRGIP